MVELAQTNPASEPFEYRPSRQSNQSSRNRRHHPPVQPTIRSKRDLNSRFAHYFQTTVSWLAPLAFSTTVAGVLFIGWLNRNEGHLTAETGTGYWLGIVGALMMLLLLLYPLRKRIKVMRSWGKVSFWFQAHMILGVLGPTLILLHSNFQLGSLNSRIALFAMLLVAGSGIVGRYLYAKIHTGLYGQKAEIRTLLEDAGSIEEILGQKLAHADIIVEELRAFETDALAWDAGQAGGLWAFLSVGTVARHRQRKVRKIAKALVGDHCREAGVGWLARRKMLNQINQYCAVYFAAVRKAARFSAFERLFRLWHVLHLPLFFLLVLAAIAHIIGVHLY